MVHAPRRFSLVAVGLVAGLLLHALPEGRAAAPVVVTPGNELAERA